MDLDLKNVSILCEVDRVRFRHRYNKTLRNLTPLQPPNLTLTVESIYSTFTAYNTFQNSSIIYTGLWRKEIALFFHIQYFYYITKLSCWYQYFTPATMWIVVRKRSKHNRNHHPPPLSTAPCDTSTTLPTAPLNVRFYYRNTSKLSAFKFHLKCTRISSGSSVY